MILSNDSSIKQLDLTKELTMIENVNYPFSSLLLRNGRQKVGSVIVSWTYETLDDSRGLAKEGSDVTDYQKSDRSAGDSNICQILRKAVAVSDTAQVVRDEHITDLFAHELNNRIIEIKRDLEYYLINGVRDDGEYGNSGNPRQMNGLLQFVQDENKVEEESLTIKVLQNMAKTMAQKGTASQNLVLLCDYNTFDTVADLFEEKTYYQGVTNEFGSPVRLLNLTYARVIPYLVPEMPSDTCLMVNMNYLKLAELRPLAYYDLAKTGSAKKGYIEMENTLKVLHPDAVVQFSKKA